MPLYKYIAQSKAEGKEKNCKTDCKGFGWYIHMYVWVHWLVNSYRVCRQACRVNSSAPFEVLWIVQQSASHQSPPPPSLSLSLSLILSVCPTHMLVHNIQLVIGRVKNSNLSELAKCKFLFPATATGIVALSPPLYDGTSE